LGVARAGFPTVRQPVVELSNRARVRQHVEAAALVMLTLGEDPSPFENVQGVVDHLGSAGLEITFG